MHENAGRILLHKSGLGNVNLRLTIVKIDVNTVADHLAVRVWIEDIADFFTLTKGVVSNLIVHIVTGVGQCN